MTNPISTDGWQVKQTATFAKQLKKLDAQTQRRILRTVAAIEQLDDPRDRGETLTAPLSNYWKYRIGDYRVLCEIQDQQLVILALQVGHRSTVYKKSLS